METGLLWREVVTDLHKREYADVQLEHMLADNAAMQLVRNPKQFDVIVTDNLFGDILSDEAADVHRLAGHAALGGAGGAGHAGPLRADPRLGARHRRPRAWPIRWPPSCRFEMALRWSLDRAGPGRPPVRGGEAPRSTTAPAPATSAAA